MNLFSIITKILHNVFQVILKENWIHFLGLLWRKTFIRVMGTKLYRRSSVGKLVVNSWYLGHKKDSFCIWKTAKSYMYILTFLQLFLKYRIEVQILEKILNLIIILTFFNNSSILEWTAQNRKKYAFYFRAVLLLSQNTVNIWQFASDILLTLRPFIFAVILLASKIYFAAFYKPCK